MRNLIAALFLLMGLGSANANFIPDNGKLPLSVTLKHNAYFPHGFVASTPYANTCGIQPVGQLWCVGLVTGYTVVTAAAGTGTCGNSGGSYTGTCVVLVSQSLGSDTCTAQTPLTIFGKSQPTSNDWASISSTTFSTYACQNPAKGQSLLRPISADWMLFKRGDTWNVGMNSTSAALNPFGSSNNTPLVLGYGSTGARPLLLQATTTDYGCLSTTSIRGQNLIILGLHCDKAIHDPSSPFFQGATITADTTAGSPILSNINAGAGLPSQFFTTAAYSLNGNGINNLAPNAAVSPGTTTLTMTGNAAFTSTQMKIQIQDTQLNGGISFDGILNTFILEDSQFDYGAIGSLGTGPLNTFPLLNVAIRRNIFNGSTSNEANLFLPSNCVYGPVICAGTGSGQNAGGGGQVTFEENASNFAAWNPNIWAYPANSKFHALYLHNPSVPVYLHGNTIGNNAADNQYRDCGPAINNLFWRNSVGLTANLQDNPCFISYNVVEQSNDNILGIRTATASPGSSGTVLSIDGVINSVIINVIGGNVVDLSNPGAIPNTAFIGAVRDGFSASLAGPTTSATINTGGTGYGASVTGTMTWAGAGCTGVGFSPPVLNVTTNGSGVISTVNSVTSIGFCSILPTTAASWTPGGGLSAGTGASFAVATITNGIRGNGVQPGDTIEIFSTNGIGMLANISGIWVDNGPANTGVPGEFAAGSITSISATSPAIVTEPSIASARSQDEPFKFGQAIINSWGTGYGASVTGTVTWSGLGCSVNPVLNVSTNSAGNITTFNSVVTAGTCSTQPSSIAANWTAGGGLSAGSGVTIIYTALFGTLPTGLSLNTWYCADPANGSSTAYPVYAANGSGLCTGGTDISATGSTGSNIARTGSRTFKFSISENSLPAVNIPSWVTVAMNVYVGASVAFPQTFSGLVGGTTGAFISADRTTLVTTDPSITAIAGSNPVGDGEQTFLFGIPGNSNNPVARFGPNNLFVNLGTQGQGSGGGAGNSAISWQNETNGNNGSGNYIYYWNRGAVANNTSDAGFPGTNLPALATSQILNCGIIGTPCGTLYPNSNVEAYDAANNGSGFNGTITGAATFNPGAGSSYDGATLTVNSGSAPAIFDYVFCAGCAQFMQVVSGSGSSFTVSAYPGTMVNVGPVAMTNGSFAHFISQEFLQNSQTGWNPTWTAAAANNYMRSGQPGTIPCGNQTTFPGSPACPQQNFLLERDINPASNDNSPVGLAKAA